jgi:putative radical SAM enzyme (TIGR03279 family)
MARAGVRIRQVEPGSPAHSLGLACGDEILSINGHAIPDEIALRFYLAEQTVRLEVRNPSGERTLFADLADGETLGVEVEDFRTRTCNNQCLFCFIDQLPQGVRPALAVKDDDYRLSFLHGNYITLTNMPERELDRIIEQALSPLYVSVHATDPVLRTQVLGRRKQDDLDGKMRKLISGGIRLHTQVVLMPEINDGANLDKTIGDLYAFHPGVASVAVVPLGLSEHGRPRDVYKPVTADYCREVISQASPWQERFRRETGRTFVYLADEFYIQGEAPLPDTAHYDEFAQIEDGIGMVRKFVDDFNREFALRRKPRPHLKGTLVTGRLFHPFLSECMNRFNRKFGSRLAVREVENRFMGRTITVAGLLAGHDISNALAGSDPGDFVVIPQEAVSRVDGILVDNLTPKDISKTLGRPVHTSGRTVHEFFTLLCHRL